MIVGSGAGGGIASYVLTRAGARVCVLEKGPWLAPEHYGDDELRFGDRNLIEQDPLIEPRTFRNSPTTASTCTWARAWISRCVGGGTVHYGAVSFRFQPGGLQRPRPTGDQLPGADIVDWPISYQDLKPYYGRAERPHRRGGRAAPDAGTPGLRARRRMAL